MILERILISSFLFSFAVFAAGILWETITYEPPSRPVAARSTKYPSAKTAFTPPAPKAPVTPAAPSSVKVTTSTPR